MARNWRNYAAYYVNPYIGNRDVWDISGEACDALYKKAARRGPHQSEAEDQASRAISAFATACS